MVGVPRSTGCQLCRKRRVKCDEVKPKCGNCLRYGAECPGYDRGIKFITGKHVVRPRGSRAKSSLPTDSSSAGSSSISSRSSSSSPRTVRSQPISPLQEMDIHMVVSPSPNRGQFVATMLETVRHTIQQKDVTGFFSWMELGHVGTSAGLDSALCSLSMHIIGKEFGHDAMVAHSRTLYGQSLTDLQRALQHHTKWKDSETLCSAILLCIFELFAGTGSSDSWLRHARGIGVLMKQRGPSAHSQGWDAAMLLSFRGILIMSDLFFPTEQGCFLAHKDWRHVMQDRRRRLIHPSDVPDEFIDAADEYIVLLAYVPEVVRMGYPILEAAKKGQDYDPVYVAAVKPLAAKGHTRFKLWYEKYKHVFPTVEQVPSQDPDSLYPIVLKYPVGWAGALQISYWATMLILQVILRLCKDEQTFDVEQQQFTRGILQSVEYLGQGPLGPYRIGYAIRIAYEVASAEAQEWIRKLLDRHSKKYAAVDKATYPETRDDAGGYS